MTHCRCLTVSVMEILFVFVYVNRYTMLSSKKVVRRMQERYVVVREWKTFSRMSAKKKDLTLAKKKKKEAYHVKKINSGVSYY